MIDCSQPIVFETADQSYGPWRQSGSGDEILQRDPPFQRYGVGVLVPIEPAGSQPTLTENHKDGLDEVSAHEFDFHELERLPGVLSDELDDESNAELVTNEKLDRLNRVASRRNGVGADENAEDATLSMANARKPSSMAISFLMEVRDDACLTVEAEGGRYRHIQIQAGDAPRPWWLRSSVSLTTEFTGAAFSSVRSGRLTPTLTTATNTDGLTIDIEVFARTLDAYSGHLLLTVRLVNRTRPMAGADIRLNTDESMLFQSEFRVTAASSQGEPLVVPYPDALPDQLDDEEQSLALLYRHEHTFAVGHGCAADWARPSPGVDRITAVTANSFPSVELPSTTPDITREDGTTVTVPMAPLAGLVDGNDGIDAIEEVIERYETWIYAQRTEVDRLDARYQPAAERHIAECQRSATRMRDGLQYLRSNPMALRAFQLANHAMLLQQSRFRRAAREYVYDSSSRRASFSEPYPSLYPNGQIAAWRPFQIAFLLASLASAADGEHAERETVELIWFPTGGGKTEAYLGLAAFAIFLRRLNNCNDTGTHVLMRYTFRLLTAQQFQRASALICAMDYLRSQNSAELGDQEISIGIWLGGESTPNTRTQALNSLKALKRDPDYGRNHFILTRCPWCGATIGPIRAAKSQPRNTPRIIGYQTFGDTVALHCPDRSCHFSESLPICVVDEDIYCNPPSLIIGTVDKFAMLTWRPQARSLFGINDRGQRISSPPGLIIQDELHLISGPLGSMVGLYETVIEELCTDRRNDVPIRPKIVSSTATIRRYAEQIKALYARTDIALFPPPGLDHGDSFFATHARGANGELSPGRLYVGVHAPGLGSLQTTQARVFASLMQAPMSLPQEMRDPWWTLLVFFNSLRELGTALSLFQTRVPDYQWALRSRMGLDFNNLRKFDHIEELTSRLRSDEVPKAITKLEVSVGGADRPIDACLASNIIEVGIDIDRLSLMTVIGQPKTTSQYIQVTGRVGRRWQERPGLVVTVLNPSRPRDRSHFERFRSYHQRLYAQVEPTSVPPFSPPAVDRALHAALVAFTRLTGGLDVAMSPQPFPDDLVDRAKQVLLNRVSVVDAPEQENLLEMFEKRIGEWRRWDHRHWDRSNREIEIAQLYVAGEYVDPRSARLSWSTPMSMRSVDAECQAEISLGYKLDESMAEEFIDGEIQWPNP